MREVNVSGSRFLRVLLALAVVLLGPGLMVASADAVSLAGTFTNGDSFTGTVTTTPGTPGTIIAGSLTVTGATDAGVYSDFFAANFGVYLFQDSQGGTPSTLPYIDLLFSGSSPISEASLCSDASLCGSSSSQLRDNSGPGPNGSFAAYDLEASVATPEPSSLLLLAIGLAGLGLFVHKRRVATN